GECLVSAPRAMVRVAPLAGAVPGTTTALPTKATMLTATTPAVSQLRPPRTTEPPPRRSPSHPNGELTGDVSGERDPVSGDLGPECQPAAVANRAGTART